MQSRKQKHHFTGFALKWHGSTKQIKSQPTLFSLGIHLLATSLVGCLHSRSMSGKKLTPCANMIQKSLHVMEPTLVCHMELDHPVTEPELKEVMKPIHKGGNRVLVYNNEACCHLKYITRKLLGKLKPNEVLPFEVEERRKQELLQEIHNMNHIELTSFIDFYLDET